MGIGPDVGANGFTACHTLGKYPHYRSVAGQAVDGTIGAVIEPRAVDHGVAGIVAQNEREKGMRRTVRAAKNIEVALGDIPFQIVVGIARLPLSSVSAFLHVGPGGPADLEKSRKVGSDRFADHGHSLSFYPS